MRLAVTTTLLTMAFTAIASFEAQADVADNYWPTWRGPNEDGVAVTGNPPIEFSETLNIKWKAPLRGGSDSTPVVWGDKIFFQTAYPTGAKPERGGPPVPYTFSVVCLDRNTGETLWERTAREETPHEGHHPHSSLASYSPITDGELLWVNYGSRGLHCYDLDGNLKWSAELVKMMTINGFGEGSSPALVGDSIIVVSDHEGDSKIYAFQKDTGELLWEKDRDEPTSWATPRGVEVNGKTQIVVSGTNFVRSYDAGTGDMVWQCSGLTRGSIATPLIGFGKAYLATGYDGFAMLAIDLGHTGDLTDSDAVAWKLDGGTPYVPSPLLYDDRIYMFESNRAVLSCYDAETGEPIYTKVKLAGMRVIYASPTGVAGRIYVVDRKGTVMVIKHSDTFEVLATNKLDDTFDASPIVVGDELYLKGDKHLYCIAK